MLCNSDLPWSVAAAQEYATIRGIPQSQIIQFPMGTVTSWSPPDNSPYYDLASTINARFSGTAARAILMAPGCPNRCQVYGVVEPNEPFDPDAWGFPPLAHLVMGAPSFTKRLGSNQVATRENGSGRWIWLGRQGDTQFGYEIWGGAGFDWMMGLSKSFSPIQDSPYVLYDQRMIEVSPGTSINLLSPLGSQFLGNSASNMLPCGRIGWGAWRNASLEVPETESNWDLPLLSSLAANYTSQPAPILVSLTEVSSSMYNYAAMAWAAIQWGYDVEYFYRTTSILSEVEDLLPVSGAIWSKTDFETGGIVGAPYFHMFGNHTNDDRPQTQEPFLSALAPVNGALIAEMGPSYTFEWSMRGFQSGAAIGNVDVTHRTSFEMPGSFYENYVYLRGMNGLERFTNAGTALPAGDPFHRPYFFDAAEELPLLNYRPEIGRVFVKSYGSGRRGRRESVYID